MSASGWRDAWETLSYEAPVGQFVGDLYRVRARIEHGQVIRYTVQYEIWIEGQAYPVVRYDSAHRRPHRDLLDWAGEVIHKQWLEYVSLDEAMNDGIETIKTDWRRFRDAFFARKP